MGALATAVNQGKALYVGISSYSASLTREAAKILRDFNTPCLIHQPSYSLFNRWIETEKLLDALEENGIGAIAFSPLAQGLLTDKYLNGVPNQSRAASKADSFSSSMLTEKTLAAVQNLNAIAAERGQTLAQMAISWVLRSPAVTSALIGVSSEAQLIDSLASVKNPSFSNDELKRIDETTIEAGINLWAPSSKHVKTC